MQERVSDGNILKQTIYDTELLKEANWRGLIENSNGNGYE
jgi:hypothetical protein